MSSSQSGTDRYRDIRSNRRHQQFRKSQSSDPRILQTQTGHDTAEPSRGAASVQHSAFFASATSPDGHTLVASRSRTLVGAGSCMWPDPCLSPAVGSSGHIAERVSTKNRWRRSSAFCTRLLLRGCPVLSGPSGLKRWTTGGVMGLLVDASTASRSPHAPTGDYRIIAPFER